MKKHAFENSSPNAPSASDSVGALSNSIHNLALHEDKTLSMTLDLDVIGYLCVFLTGLQLCRLRRVSKACLNIVDEFMRRAFSVDYVFSRFFTPDQIASLRRIQAKTNFVVSGSAVVQFFERAMFPDSDLDLYVEEQHVKMLALFITQSGYVFKHSPHQPGSLLAALKDRSDWVTVSGEGPTKYGFIDTVPMMVFTFEKELTSGAVRKVQVIVSYRTDDVMAIILAFHSTLVMNIITYNSAVALFPVSSFHRHHTLVTASNSKVEACLDKYRTRGWRSIRVGETMSDDLHPECKKGTSRSTTDSWCWTIPLSPVEDCDSTGIIETSWEISQRRDLDSVMYAEMWINIKPEQGADKTWF